MITLHAAGMRGITFDTKGQAYALSGPSMYSRLHLLYAGRTESLNANAHAGQIRVNGGDLYVRDTVFIEQTYGAAVHKILAVRRDGQHAHSRREIVWIEISDEAEDHFCVGHTTNRIPIGGSTLLDVGSARRPDQVPGKYSYIRAFELFGLPAEQPWDEFFVQVCGEHVAVMRAPNITHEVPATLAVFHRDRWQHARLYTMPKSGGHHTWSWFQKMSRGFAHAVEAGRWLYYPTSDDAPFEITLPPNDMLFDVCGDVFVSGIGSPGVRIGRIGGPVRHYVFHGPKKCSAGGALSPDGLTAYVWARRELVKFDIDV